MPKRVLPETSLDAKRSLDPSTVWYVYERVKEGLSVIGEGTFEEISAQIHIEPSRVWKRLGEMSKLNMIYRPGNKRKLKSGRNGFTWRLVEKDGSTQKVTESSPPGSSVGDYSKKLIQNKLF